MQAKRLDMPCAEEGNKVLIKKDTKRRLPQVKELENSAPLVVHNYLMHKYLHSLIRPGSALLHEELWSSREKAKSLARPYFFGLDIT